MKTVLCPVTGQKIDGDTCYCIVVAVDGEAPESCLPENVSLSEETRTKCRSCQYHDDL